MALYLYVFTRTRVLSICRLSSPGKRLMLAMRGKEILRCSLDLRNESIVRPSTVYVAVRGNGV